MQSIHQGAHDGQSFIRFFRHAMMALAIAMFSTTAMAEKVNLNQADAETLQYIPGIGPGKSAAIIKLRDQNGGFESLDQLLEVRGIGESVLKDIKEYGTLEGGVSTLTQEMQDNPPGKKVSATDVDQNQTSG